MTLRNFPIFLLGLALSLSACEVKQKPKIDIQAPSTQPAISIPKPIPLPEPEDIQPLTSQEQSYTIATLLPLSGQSANLGRQISQGIETAFYRYGRNHQKIRFYDTQGRRFAAIQAGKKAFSDGADVIIGPLFSHSAAAIIPLAQEQQVPLITFSNNNALLEQTAKENQNSSVHILGITPKEELRQLIEVSTLSGLQNFALIAPNDSYGQQIQQDMQEIVSENFANFARSMLYDPANVDFSEQIQQLSDYHERRNAYKQEMRRLENSGITSKREREKLLGYKETFGSVPFDAVILITYDDNSLRTLAAQLEYYEVEPETVQYMGLRQWQNFRDLHLEPSLRGSWFVGLDQKRAALFEQLHQQLYQEPTTFFTALGFDTVTMLTHFNATQASPIPIALQQRQGIIGATGAYRLENDGTVSRKMSLFEVTPKGVEVRLNAEESWR